MTNRELAQRFGISPAAFSLILNQKPGVSDATRSRVIAELRQMGYTHLLKKIPQSETVEEPLPSGGGQLCFVTYKRHGQILNQHPFFMLLMESIEEQARRQGYHIVLMTVDHTDDVPEQLKVLNTMNIQGILLFALEMLPEDIALFQHIDLPLVALDNQFSRLPVHTVSIDNEMGTYQAMAYLAQMGHQKIGYLQSDVPVSSFLEREAGYHAAAKELGLELCRTYRIPYTEAGSYQSFRQILAEHPDLPDAFVSDDDTIAAGALRALTEAGYRVPDDFSIIGFNDRPSCELTVPPLTSVNVSRSSYGAEGVDALVRLIRMRKQGLAEIRPCKLRIGTQLVRRASVAENERPPITK